MSLQNVSVYPGMKASETRSLVHLTRGEEHRPAFSFPSKKRFSFSSPHRFVSVQTSPGKGVRMGELISLARQMSPAFLPLYHPRCQHTQMHAHSHTHASRHAHSHMHRFKYRCTTHALTYVYIHTRPPTPNTHPGPEVLFPSCLRLKEK